MTNLIPGIPSELTSLPPKLMAAGVPVPPAFLAGLERAKWGPKGADVSPAMEALRAAKTREEFDAAVDLYVLAETRNRIVTEQGTNFANTLDSLRQQSAAQGFIESRLEMSDSLIAAFATVAEQFTRVFDDVPDINGLSPFNIPAEVSAKLAEAKELATKLNLIYDAFVAVWYGHTSNVVRNTRTPANTGRLATAIGDYGDSFTAASDAASLILGYNTPGAASGSFGPIAPWCAVLMAGGKLHLVTPDENEEYRDTLSKPTMKEVSEKAFYGYPVG